MHTFFIYKTFFLFNWHRRLYSELYNKCQLSPLKYENIKFSEFLEKDFKFLWPQFQGTKLNKKCIFQNFIRPPHKKDPQNSCVFSLISAQFFFHFIFLCNSNLLIWWFIFLFWSYLLHLSTFHGLSLCVLYFLWFVLLYRKREIKIELMNECFRRIQCFLPKKKSIATTTVSGRLY